MDQDPEKLFPLIRRINDLLGANEERLVPTSTQMLQPPPRKIRDPVAVLNPPSPESRILPLPF